MKLVTLLTLLILLLFSAQTGMAQYRWSAEFSPGLSFPTQDIANENLEIGFGFDASLAYKLMPHLRAYAGYNWNEFKTEMTPGRSQLRVNEGGLIFGFELTFPISSAPVTYFGFIGGNLNQLKIEMIAANQSMSTDHKLGWHIGVGLDYAFHDQWSLRPKLNYQALTSNNPFIPANDLKLQYVSLGLGLLRSF